jgi:hypothetical protein
MRTLYILLLTFIPLFSFGQNKFILTPEGLRNSEDLNKEYVLIEAKGKSAEEIYSAARNFILQTSKNPMKAIKADTEGQYIRYGIFVPEFAYFKKMGLRVMYEGHIEIEMRFKDDKLRIDVPTLYMPTTDGDNQLYLTASKWKGWAIFDKNGKTSLKDPKEQVETFFNSLLSTLDAFINKVNPDIVSDDW